MRNHYKSALKNTFHEHLFRRRVELNISQEKMAERLAMANRTYIELDHGKSCCSAVTLALFLVYICSNPVQFLEELRHAFEADDTEAA